MTEKSKIRPLFRFFTAILSISSAIGLAFCVIYQIDAHNTVLEYKERLANYAPIQESGNHKIDLNIKRMNTMQKQLIKMTINTYEYVKKRFLLINIFLILFLSFFSWVTIKGDVPFCSSILNWKIF